MTFADLSKVDRPTGFNLYLPPDAPAERRIAHRKLAEAAGAMEKAADAESRQAALDMQDRAQRNYGAILLREDKRNRPYAYAK